jgi:signal transduction histidine kinase
VEKSNKVLSNLDLILSKLHSAEQNINSYLLTNNKQFIEPYLSNRHYVDSLYADTEVMHATYVDLPNNLAMIKTKLNNKDALIGNALQTYNDANFVQTAEVKNSISRSLLLSDSIQNDIVNLQLKERKLLAQETARLQKTSDGIYGIIISSTIIAFFLVVFGFSRHLKENNEKIKAENKARAYEDELNKSIKDLQAANEVMIKMRSQEKFDATGRIARTIAHEIRNPLTNINLATDQLSTEMAPDENNRFLFEMINRNSNRINQLISDLLNSTKFSELNYEKVSINSLLEETLQLAQDRIHLNNVKLVKNYSNEICDITCDKEKLKIAFLNIVINAMEAMEGKANAVFTIETKKLEDKCVVVMKDTGHGVDEESLQQLFEPYFTKKQKGNGLGLTNTQNIILNHQGTIMVKSQLQQGTCFTITLGIQA